MSETMIGRECPTCGKEFVVRLTDTKRGQGVFCSKRCAAIHRSSESGKYDSYLRAQELLAKNGPKKKRPGVEICYTGTAAKCVCGDPEIWMPLRIDSENYSVSSHGRLLVVRTGKLINPVLTKQGYLRYRHRVVAGQYKNKSIHSAVATAFFGPAPAGHTHVNHKDFSRSHNCVGNLEWCTPKENSHHALAAGRLFGKSLPVKYTPELGEKIVEMLHADATWTDMEREIGVSRTTIRRWVKETNYVRAS